jgi:hypothetical protein
VRRHTQRFRQGLLAVAFAARTWAPFHASEHSVVSRIASVGVGARLGRCDLLLIKAAPWLDLSRSVGAALHLVGALIEVSLRSGALGWGLL